MGYIILLLLAIAAAYFIFPQYVKGPVDQILGGVRSLFNVVVERFRKK